MAEANQVSSGVQELIERLRGEGVEAGRQEAERLVAEARREAESVVSAARREADELRERTRADIASEREAAHEAIRLAVRDTVLDLESQLTSRFGAQLKRLVKEALSDAELLRRSIVALAGRAGDEMADKDLELVLPEDLFDAESDAGGEVFDRLTLDLSAELLRDGIEIGAGEHAAGIRVRIVGEDVEVDLSEQAVSRLLLAHLTPRFRDLLAGMVPQKA